MHPLALVGRPEERRERLRLELVRRGERHVGSAKDDTLHRRDRQRALRSRSSPRPRALWAELRMWYDRIDQADAQGFVRADDVAVSCKAPARAPIADAPREPLRAAEAGNDAEIDFRLAELRLVARVDEVAGEGELAPAAQREAVDRAR